MASPTSSDVSVPGTGGRAQFRCSGCSGPMSTWKHGSKCEKCRGPRNGGTLGKQGMTKAAPKPGAKPAAAAGKAAGTGGAGNVQSEFPSCPGCGSPSRDGNLCADCKRAKEREHATGDEALAQSRLNTRGTEMDMEEENERRDIRRRARAVMARMLGLDDDEKIAKAVEALNGLTPAVVKAAPAARYTMAPMYMPGQLDAHGEFVQTAEELQKATWEYVRKTGADRTVYLQHIDKPAGEWVEITSWPYAVEAPMRVPTPDGGSVLRKANLPAGTVYMGVVWQPWSWELVKKGRLLGFSMGGWAKRVEAELADVSITKNASNQSGGSWEAWDEAGVVNPQHPALAALLPFDEAAAREALGLD